MASGSQIRRCYQLVKALLQGEELDRQAVAKMLSVKPAAADNHINALVANVPGVRQQRRRHRRTIRFVGDAAPGVAPQNLAAAACFGASLARLFRGTAYETRFDEVRRGVTRRASKPQEFDDARRKFLFITQAGEFALPDRLGILDELVEAVLKQQRVHIDYTGFGGDERSVEISPWSIAIYDHQLYVLAEGESSAPRAYRLSRIRSLHVRATRFKYPDRSAYDPENLFRDTFGIFIRGEDPLEDVVLRLSPAWRTYAHTHVWHASQRVSDDPDGGVTVRMRVRTCNELEAFVLGFGGEAEVLAPAPFRERIVRQVEALHRKYLAAMVVKPAGAARARRSPQDVSVGVAQATRSSSRRSVAQRRRARGTKPPAQAET